jgi:poly-gamma-glutamate synthesis protein (capsule biosynthesis protein)
MHPQNLQILKSGHIDAACLANNHIADFGTDGVVDTLRELKEADIKHAGAGMEIADAEAPAVMSLPTTFGDGNEDNNKRILLYSTSHISSGVPFHWKATPSRPGVHMTDLSSQSVDELRNCISKSRRASGDVVILSIHWGGNWGYNIDPAFTNYAHEVIDMAGVDVVFGHSSHHPQAVEIYKGKLIIYGAGDFINDYEGIRDSGTTGEGMDMYRGDLALMYIVNIDATTGNLITLELVPRKIHNFRLQAPDEEECQWMCENLSAQYAKFGHQLECGNRVDDAGNDMWFCLRLRGV